MTPTAKDLIQFPAFSEEDIDNEIASAIEATKKFRSKQEEFSQEWDHVDSEKRPDEAKTAHLELLSVAKKSVWLWDSVYSMLEANFAVINSKTTIKEAINIHQERYLVDFETEELAQKQFDSIYSKKRK